MRPIIRHHQPSAALLLAPCLLVAVAFLIYPLLNGIWLSFTNASAMRQTYRFVGFSNYSYLLASSEFYVVLLNSALLVGGAILLSIVAGFGLALLLNQKLPGAAFFRAGVFQVWIVPWISVAILWGWIFNSDYGIVNHILIGSGATGGPVKWFSESWTARLVIVAGFAWRMIPFMMVVSLAAIQNIPSEILEAASVDGATPWQRLTRVTLPLLRPILATLAVLQLVKLFQEITLPWILTQGGPINATTTLSLYTYKLAFQQWDYGLAAAAGAIWLVLLTGFGVAALRFSRRRFE